MGGEDTTAVVRRLERLDEARWTGPAPAPAPAAVDERRPLMTTEPDGARGAGGLRPEWLLDRDGTRYVRYAGLLALAHARGLKRITTTLVQAPARANGHVAIAAAEVETDQGVFAAIGAAALGDVRRQMAPALPRLAETRAKAQALADAVNVGLPVFEARAPAPGAGAPRSRP
jgi:phosphatidylserine/phosphatidylglycerophosphate/cardiolipin synthase-like enzyme